MSKMLGVDVDDELARVRAERDKLREENAKLQGICADGGRRIADLRAERDEYVLKVSSLEKYIKSLQADRDVTAQLADALQADNDGILEQAERLQAELDTARRDLQVRYTPEGWRLLQSGEVLQEEDWIIDSRDGNGCPTRKVGSRVGEHHVGEHQVYIRRIEPQSQPEPEPEPENCGFEGHILREQPQPVQVREGRWRTRNGEVRNVTPTPSVDSMADIFPWHDAAGRRHRQLWRDDGKFINGVQEHGDDLVKYLGPIEPEPEQTTSEQIAEPEPQAGYTAPEGWRVLQVGEVISRGDMWVRSADGQLFESLRIGERVRYEYGPFIRRIEPQPVQNNIPGHIWLTDAENGGPVLVSLPGVAQATKAGVAQAAEARAHWIPAGMGGWHITVKETPDQIASLIQQEWCDRNSTGGAASAANTGGLIGAM